MMAHIGLDLDNTIIDYDAAFPRVGEAAGILPPGHGLASKAAVKAHLLAREGGMAAWMRLQGRVYGADIDAAVPFAGATAFIAAMLGCGHRVTIVSHKTRFGHFDESGTRLWDAARGWLRQRRLLTNAPGGLRDEDVIFAETRAAKLRWIARLACDVFVDDLLVVLLHPDFPAGVKRLWFAGRDDGAAPPSPLEPHATWAEIANAVERYLNAREPSAGNRLTD